MKKPFAYPLAIILLLGDTFLSLVEAALNVRLALPSSRTIRNHI